MAQLGMLSPGSLAEAVTALRKRGAMALAGATDVIPSIRRREIAPRVLVNLKGIPALAGISRSGSAVRIGALTTVAEVLRSEIIQRDLPLLAEVARSFASVQIRNLATVGGNLCNAAPSADMGPPLLVLDAVVECRGRTAREMAIADFFLGAGKTALRRGELLTAVLVPRPAGGWGTAYEKLGIRQAMDLAIVSVAAAVRLTPGGRCKRARIALGAVAPTPVRAYKAEQLIEGVAPTPEMIAQAAAMAAKECRPISDHRASREYRRKMVETLACRALLEAVRRARKEVR